MTSLKILLVDDKDYELELFARHLTRAGHTITKLLSPEQTLDLLRDPNAQYDVLVTDYNMPAMTGKELVEAMLAIPHRQGMPFIIHTGKDLEEDRDLRMFAKRNGGQAISKNHSDPSILLGRIQRVLELSKRE